MLFKLLHTKQLNTALKTATSSRSRSIFLSNSWWEMCSSGNRTRSVRPGGKYRSIQHTKISEIQTGIFGQMERALHFPFLQVCSWEQKYIIPHAACHTWFRNLFCGAVLDFQRRFPSSQYTLSEVDQGPGVQLNNVYMKLIPMIKPLLFVNLVPCFHIMDKHFVHKRCNRCKMDYKS